VRVAVALLVAVVVPAVLVSLTVVRHPTFSRLDEPAHSDYLRRIEDGEVPRVGDKMLEQTVEDIQCRTVQGNRNAPCGLPSYSTELLGANGYQYEAQQPPLYYVITALLRQPARIGPADDFVTTARLTGVAWLSAGLLVFFAACRRLGCRWWPTTLVTLLLGIGPGVVYQTATINNDAAAILTGSLALLMFATLRERVAAWPLVLWSAVAVGLVLVKPTGVISIAAAAAGLIVDAAADRRLTRRTFAAFLVPLAAGLATYLSWGAVRDHRATVDYDVVLDALLSFKMVDHLPLSDVGAALTRLLGAYAPGALPISPAYVGSAATVLMIFFTAAGLASLWIARGGEPAQRLATVALLALVVGGPAFTVLFYVDYSVEGGPTSRYGLSLLPLLFAGGAATYRTRRALAAMAAVGLVLLVLLVRVIAWPVVVA
jgi:hypothetical protein